MKKTFIIAILIMLVFNLTACGFTKKENKLNEQAIISGSTESTSKKMVVDFSEKQIEIMSNYMNGGRTVSSGAWLYGISFLSNGRGSLTKIKNDGSEQKRMMSEWPTFINIVGNWLYYIGSSYDNNITTISKIRISGEDKTHLDSVDGKAKYFNELFIYNNKLYYTMVDESDKSNITGKFYSIDFNGENKTEVLDKAVYYPYIINDKIYYQDDNDYCRIHVCDLDGKNDKVFINEWVYQYIFNGENFYYVTYEDKNLEESKLRVDENFKNKEIVKYCDINGENNKVLIDYTDVQVIAMNRDTLFYTDKKDDLRIYSYKFSDESVDLISNDANTDSIMILGNLLSYIDYDNNEEYIDNIFYCNLDGTNKSELFKNENK